MTNSDTARAVDAKAQPAVWDDAPKISDTLGRAFFDDPVMSFLLPDDKTRAAKLTRLFRMFLKLGLPHGACDVTDKYEAVALWRPPHRWHVPFYQYITNGPEFLGIFGGNVFKAMAVMDRIEKRHPKEPHFYLQVLGTDPDKQGKGFASVVMRRHLEITDQAGLPAYLESSKTTNIPIYQSFGFELTGEIALPGGGPSVYPMWRAARR